MKFSLYCGSGFTGSPPVREEDGTLYLPLITISNPRRVVYGPRAGSIQGHFGTQTPEGVLVPLSVKQIVNETERTVYDPANAEWVAIANFAYDYDNRMYYINLSDTENLESADVKVTFGDNYVTFVRGEEETTIYYIVPFSLDESFLKGIIVGQRLREWAMARRD